MNSTFLLHAMRSKELRYLRSLTEDYTVIQAVANFRSLDFHQRYHILSTIVFFLQNYHQILLSLFLSLADILTHTLALGFNSSLTLTFCYIPASHVNIFMNTSVFCSNFIFGNFDSFAAICPLSKLSFLHILCIILLKCVRKCVFVYIKLFIAKRKFKQDF